MSPRLTPEQRTAREMQKLKDMGITISTSPAPGVPTDGSRVVDIIGDAAKHAGIYFDSRDSDR
jgi:hypothetical protein